MSDGIAIGRGDPHLGTMGSRELPSLVRTCQEERSLSPHRGKYADGQDGDVWIGGTAGVSKKDQLRS